MIEIESVSFRMQARTDRVKANTSATEFVALAFSAPENETVEIQVTYAHIHCSCVWYA